MGSDKFHVDDVGGKLGKCHEDGMERMVGRACSLPSKSKADVSKKQKYKMLLPWHQMPQLHYSTAL